MATETPSLGSGDAASGWRWSQREVQPNLVCGDRRREGLELWAWWAKGMEEDESVDADSGLSDLGSSRF